MFFVSSLGFMASGAAGQVRITEYEYSGNGAAAEFVEFTNIGTASVDLTGWSYDDSSRVPGTTDLSAFGSVAAGESVILCEAEAATFIAAWSLSGVQVIGGNAANLGRNDEINLFDSGDALVDRITYGDQDIPGTIRTQGSSGWPCATAVGANDITSWVLSTLSDEQGSVVSTEGNVGSPGAFVSFTCPDPDTGACCEAGDCNQRSEIDCASVGIYQGDGTDCGSVTCPAPSGAVVRITEYMHGGNGGEYIEFTNLDTVAVDMTGWSYSDETRHIGQVDLSAFGTIAAGESVILTETIAGDFVVDWSLSGVQVIGGNTVNIGADDEVNLYDASGALVDRLTYGTGDFPGTIDADGAGGWPCSTAVGANNIYDWRRSAVGDGQGSYYSLVGDVGNPGSYASVVCGPGSCCILGACSVLTKAACDLAGGLFLGDDTDCATTPCPTPSDAAVRITEYMYDGLGSEFAEFTNLDSGPVDMTGWSFSDAGQPGVFDLSGLGTVGSGESVIMTAVDPIVFRTDWGLSAGVKVVRIPTNELGRNDVIQLYDNSGSIVDELHYGDEDYPGSIRTQESSGWPFASAVGQDNIFGWQLSVVGDAQGSHASGSGDVGSPGEFELIGDSPVPAVSEWGLIVFGLLLMVVGTCAFPRRRAAGSV